ncbi:hypothetical protein PC129_g4574 [Phytophthora cactorum]|uniref:Uncharacterized protein n=1 Tax=Phytophthora cactorum TaxID=29920 RepID=A0A329RSR8_9STRA|nr:hypothetical protein Pcac1_g10080 [Phytophthora cactorum]KAG2922844.1 hypothetical protein PC114_g5058 [Phytophthora cactorum]KAG2930646.1 hypothetical protein PC115_g6430 [Phytophthora cactorum]KAG2949836.1 hypothetical protein PC117_g4927 [Phytophthora cactorum]KAG3015224.1 hypothetical protein PC119_g11846 [Phytophthora cactorum]
MNEYTRYTNTVMDDMSGYTTYTSTGGYATYTTYTKTNE